ncbi:ArsR/SmtB family transcription factor [Actinomadura yumaensis]|uniref:ArsR/SmtB family transcription factor n=1 Tax=Actinomadura yumaensis TaxID=111807 RepID=A0ABW2CAR1_9ACTN
MTEQPPPKELTDPEQVRLLAHPLRQRIAQILRNGPVSSTSLARELGESTGSTSYHLRRLAKYGFVEEVPELAKGRERWWRVVPGDRRLPPYSRQSPRMREAVGQMLRTEYADEMELLERFQRARDGLGPWGDALLFSYSTVTLAPEQVRPFFEEYIALIYRYRVPDGEPRPPGTRTLHARFRAFPEVTEAEAEATTERTQPPSTPANAGDDTEATQPAGTAADARDRTEGPQPTTAATDATDAGDNAEETRPPGPTANAAHGAKETRPPDATANAGDNAERTHPPGAVTDAPDGADGAKEAPDGIQ